MSKIFKQRNFYGIRKYSVFQIAKVLKIYWTLKGHSLNSVGLMSLTKVLSNMHSITEKYFHSERVRQELENLACKRNFEQFKNDQISSPHGHCRGMRLRQNLTEFVSSAMNIYNRIVRLDTPKRSDNNDE